MRKLLILTFVLSLLSLSALADPGEKDSTPSGAEHCADDRNSGKTVKADGTNESTTEGSSTTKK